MAAGEASRAGPALTTPIAALDTFVARVPLDDPLVVFGRVISERDFIFVRIRAGNVVGTGYAFTRDAPLEHIVRTRIAPLVVGRPAGATRAIWDAARAAMRMVGEEGYFARALAVVDIALWDLVGQLVGAPLWRLLGGASASVPCLAIMGYYREEDPLGAVGRDAEQLVEAGYTRFKIPFGMDAGLDRRRVELLRGIVGPDAIIALDAGAAFNSIKEALASLRQVERYDIAFLEDPFAAAAWELAGKLAQASPIPIAFGESLASLRILQRLSGHDGVDILRVDATHQMGVTGYLQAAAAAQKGGVRLFPHYFPDLHAPLLGALGGEMIEESPDRADTTGFRHLRAAPPDIRGGTWHLTERPGFGITWDETAIERFRLAASREMERH